MQIQSEAVQDYVKQIYLLQSLSGKASTTQLAERMDVSPAAATAMVKKLADLGLVEHRRYHGAQLTPAGERIAVEVLRHHRLLELYLTEALGLPWDSVHVEAERLEHVLSDELEAALDQALGFPDTDPHGDPIPSADLVLRADTTSALVDLEPGQSAVVRRVPDDDRRCCATWPSLGLVPAARVRMVEKAPFDGPVSIEVEAHRAVARRRRGGTDPRDAGMTPRAVQAAVVPAEGFRPPLARMKRVLPFLGPAFVASVAYMDPGNFATNIQAGAKYGYMLLWVLLVSNLMAILIQSLSAKLGIASGMTLPEAIRAHTTRRTRIGLWVAAEAAAMATDLAEFLGAAVGMRDPVRAGTVPVGADHRSRSRSRLLAVQRHGHSRFEVLIMAFVAVIGACFIVEIFISNPDPAGIVRGMLVPNMSSGAIYVAVGMVGATVMPHVVYLHSGLVQPRNKILRGTNKREHFRRELVDIALAMNGAWLINSAMVIMAQPCSSRAGSPSPGSRTHRQTLQPLLGEPSRRPPSGSRCWRPGSHRRRSARWPGR